MLSDTQYNCVTKRFKPALFVALHSAQLAAEMLTPVSVSVAAAAAPAPEPVSEDICQRASFETEFFNKLPFEHLVNRFTGQASSSRDPATSVLSV